MSETLNKKQENRIKKESQSDLGIQILVVLTALVAMALLVVVSVPNLRKTVSEFFQSDKREVLAKATADFNGEGLRFTVMKIAYKGSILVEVFPYGDWQEEKEMIDRHQISNAKDAHFNFQNSSTNLALVDIDNDAILEILVPTYDWQQNPRLNVFKLREDQRGFDLSTQ